MYFRSYIRAAVCVVGGRGETKHVTRIVPDPFGHLVSLVPWGGSVELVDDAQAPFMLPVEPARA